MHSFSEASSVESLLGCFPSGGADQGIHSSPEPWRISGQGPAAGDWPGPPFLSGHQGVKDISLCSAPPKGATPQSPGSQAGSRYISYTCGIAGRIDRSVIDLTHTHTHTQTWTHIQGCVCMLVCPYECPPPCTNFPETSLGFLDASSPLARPLSKMLSHTHFYSPVWFRRGGNRGPKEPLPCSHASPQWPGLLVLQDKLELSPCVHLDF